MGIDASPQLHTRYGTNCHQKSETVKHLTILKVSKNLLIYPEPWLIIQKDYGIVLRIIRTRTIRHTLRDVGYNARWFWTTVRYGF